MIAKWAPLRLSFIFNLENGIHFKPKMASAFSSKMASTFKFQDGGHLMWNINFQFKFESPLAVPAGGGDGDTRLPAAGVVSAGAAAGRQAVGAQQRGRQSRLVERTDARQGE